MTHLSINLNKIALLRNQRDIGIPSVTAAARTIIAAGAHGITVHPRPDARHIRPSDVTALATLLADEYGGRIEYNIEGNPEPAYMALVRQTRPTQATLVPDSPEQNTSDQGWNIAAEAGRLREVIAELHELGIRVSLFVDPDADMVALAKTVGADRVELYTGLYAHVFGTPDEAQVFARYVEAAKTAQAVGLGLNAGHDLNLNNLPTLRRAMPWLAEVSIGHAFTADALWMGFEQATKAYLEALQK